MRKLCMWLAVVVGAAGGIVAACHNDVPPAMPLPLPPTREVSPMGPKPGPLIPTPPITPDAGIGARVIESQVRFAAHASDAGVDAIDELPPVPDASVVGDAALPLR